MKVNIYYGGRGLIEDPTLYILDKITSVLEELRVEVKRYNIYEKKNEISILPKTLKEVDGIILASTIEWFGIGGYMQQFLDSCWLYGDKGKISSQLMLPIITSSSFGESEGLLHIRQSWEIIGGRALNGLGVYVKNHVDFETNKEYGKMIEDEAENFYRYINKNLPIFESSTSIYKKNIEVSRTIEFSPQESEQLSAYVSDDKFVKKQKEDIEELTELFKNMMVKGEGTSNQMFINNFKKSFNKEQNFNGTFMINIEDLDKSLVIEIDDMSLNCYYGTKNNADVIIKANKSIINDLVLGRITLYGAFMAGNITAKGDFQKLKMFDNSFNFNVL